MCAVQLSSALYQLELSADKEELRHQQSGRSAAVECLKSDFAARNHWGMFTEYRLSQRQYEVKTPTNRVVRKIQTDLGKTIRQVTGSTNILIGAGKQYLKK